MYCINCKLTEADDCMIVRGKNVSFLSKYTLKCLGVKGHDVIYSQMVQQNKCAHARAHTHFIEEPEYGKRKDKANREITNNRWIYLYCICNLKFDITFN